MQLKDQQLHVSSFISTTFETLSKSFSEACLESLFLHKLQLDVRFSLMFSNCATSLHLSP